MLPVITVISLIFIVSGFFDTRAAVNRGDEVQAEKYGFLTMFGVSLFIGVLIALALFHT